MTTMVDGTTVGTDGGPALRSASALGARLNWLRAGVMGANDGIASTAAHLGGASRTRGAVRTVLGGVVAMAVTWGIGSLVGLQL